MSSTTDYHQHSRGYIRRAIGTCSMKVRQEIAAMFSDRFHPSNGDLVLDVGASADTDVAESNAFLRSYPYPRRLVASGIDCMHVTRAEFPDITFVMANATALPFRDGSFQLAVAHATIEHVGSRKDQALLVAELVRVSQGCMITTPNRNFPIELHTFLPFLHYLSPVLHRGILRFLGFTFYASEANLNLLNERQLRSLFPPTARVQLRKTRLRTNIIAFASNT